MSRPWDSEPAPRTDEKAAEWVVVEGVEDQIVLASFARSLERRLRAAERCLLYAYDRLMAYEDPAHNQDIATHLKAARQEDGEL